VSKGGGSGRGLAPTQSLLIHMPCNICAHSNQSFVLKCGSYIVINLRREVYNIVLYNNVHGVITNG
jgi:hypothetical protein